VNSGMYYYLTGFMIPICRGGLAVTLKNEAGATIFTSSSSTTYGPERSFRVAVREWLMFGICFSIKSGKLMSCKATNIKVGKFAMSGLRI